VFKVLIIGTGSIGERHLRCFGATLRANLAICETNDQLRRRIAEQYHVQQAFSRLEDALQQHWDVAVIATPAPTHVPIATTLARQGIDLLIEKPLSTTLEGVETLLSEVNARDLVAAVAYVYRTHPALAAMKRAIASGRFGAPLQVVAACGQHFPFYRPAYREIYYTDRAQGGGAVQDALTHVINAAEWLVGPVDRLVADAAHQHLQGVTVEDTVHVLARHGSVLGSYTLNQYQAPDEITITVVCENGTARFEVHRCRWRWMTEPDKQQWHDEQCPQMQRDEWFTRQANAFLDAVEHRTPPPCTLAEGIQTLKVNLAALRSADEQAGWVRVNA